MPMPPTTHRKTTEAGAADGEVLRQGSTQSRQIKLSKYNHDILSGSNYPVKPGHWPPQPNQLHPGHFQAKAVLHNYRPRCILHLTDKVERGRSGLRRARAVETHGQVPSAAGPPRRVACFAPVATPLNASTLSRRCDADLAEANILVSDPQTVDFDPASVDYTAALGPTSASERVRKGRCCSDEPRPQQPAHRRVHRAIARPRRT